VACRAVAWFSEREEGERATLLPTATPMDWTGRSSATWPAISPLCCFLNEAKPTGLLSLLHLVAARRGSTTTQKKTNANNNNNNNRNRKHSFGTRTEFLEAYSSCTHPPTSHLPWDWNTSWTTKMYLP
jgi:hypothetical protein